MHPSEHNAGEARERGAVRVGEWVLYPDLGMLWKTGKEVRLHPKALHTLLVLVDAGDRGVSRDTLLERVWGSGYPSDYVVSRAIADLRAAFGEKAGEQRYIRTLPKYGYQLLATIGPVGETPPAKTTHMARRAALAIVAVAMLFVFWPTPVQQPALPEARPLTAAPGLEHQPRLSPDGNWVIYAALKPQRADWDLFRVSLSSGQSQPVAVSPGITEHGPAFSPDGNQVAYIRMGRGRCDIVIQPVVLGVPEPIAGCTTKFLSLVDWSPDGDWLVYTGARTDDPDNRRRIYQVNIASGLTRRLSSDVSLTGSDFYPRFSPDGGAIAFLRGEPQPDHRSTLWVVDVASGKERALSQQPAPIGGMTWLEEDRLLYTVAESGRMRAKIIDLASGADSSLPLNNVLHPEYNREHATLVVVRKRRDRDLAIVEADGSVHSVAVSTFDDHHARYSPDGQWLTFVSGRSGYDEIWLASVTGEAVRKLTSFAGTNVRYPGWQSSSRIIFTAQGDAGEKLFATDLISGEQIPLPMATGQGTTPWSLPGGNGYVYGCMDDGQWGICVSKDGTEPGFTAAGFYQPQPVGNEQVVVVDDAGALYRLSLENGSTQLLWDGLPLSGRTGWAVQGDNIYFIDGGDGGGNGRIVQRNLATGRMNVLFEGEMPVADTNLSINPVTGAIMFTRYQAASDDLVVYEGVEFQLKP